VDVSIIIAAVSVLVAFVSLVTTIHYKQLAKSDSTLKDVLIDVNRIDTKVTEMQLDISAIERDVSSLERDTRRLETSFEKEVVKMSEKVDKVHDMIFNLVKERRRDD